MISPAWIGLAIYIVFAVLRHRRDTKAEAYNKELQRDIIDMRERITRIEETQYVKIGLDQLKRKSA